MVDPIGHMQACMVLSGKTPEKKNKWFHFWVLSDQQDWSGLLQGCSSKNVRCFQKSAMLEGSPPKRHSTQAVLWVVLFLFGFHVVVSGPTIYLHI